MEIINLSEESGKAIKTKQWNFCSKTIPFSKLFQCGTDEKYVMWKIKFISSFLPVLALQLTTKIDYI